MPDRPHARLRVEPDMIPLLRDLFLSSAEVLTEKLADLERDGRIRDVWMNDPVSARFRDFYNEHVMTAAEGGYHSLVAYRDELRNVYNALGEMQRNYEQAEATNETMTAGLSRSVR